MEKNPTKSLPDNYLRVTRRQRPAVPKAVPMAVPTVNSRLQPRSAIAEGPGQRDN